MVSKSLFLGLGAFAISSVQAKQCKPSSFTYPKIPGAKFTSIEAKPVTGYVKDVPVGYNPNQGAAVVDSIDFCNVTLTYTHIGQTDSLQVQLWLPTTGYSGRMQAIGGGGWVAGLNAQTEFGMAVGVDEGYAMLTGNAGLYARISLFMDYC
jgi:hypothetical protein